MPNLTGALILKIRGKNLKFNAGKCFNYFEQQSKSLLRIEGYYNRGISTNLGRKSNTSQLRSRYPHYLTLPETISTDPDASWYITNGQVHQNLQVGTIISVITPTCRMSTLQALWTSEYGSSAITSLSWSHWFKRKTISKIYFSSLVLLINFSDVFINLSMVFLEFWVKTTFTSFHFH